MTTMTHVPTVGEFFDAMNTALDAGADVPIDNPTEVAALAIGLDLAGYRIERTTTATKVAHPDGRSFRYVAR